MEIISSSMSDYEFILTTRYCAVSGLMSLLYRFKIIDSYFLMAPRERYAFVLRMDFLKGAVIG